MRERPILFSGEMVRAILDGRKTQTRRPMKVQPDSPGVTTLTPAEEVWYIWPTNDGVEHFVRCPHGQPSDRLWVRETFLHGVDGYTSENGEWVSRWGWRGPVEYVADGAEPRWLHPESQRVWMAKRPSIHMPRWASRLTLGITHVRGERLQQISEADAIAEGIAKSDDEGLRSWPWLGATHPAKGTPKAFPTARQAFASLWDSLNAERKGGIYAWDRNPYVWVLSFRVVDA